MIKHLFQRLFSRDGDSRQEREEELDAREEQRQMQEVRGRLDQVREQIAIIERRKARTS